MGFAWAFLRAGASRVIAGLWDVDDRSTAELMDRLYAGIAAGDTASHALREAKLRHACPGRQLCEAVLLGARSSSSRLFPDAVISGEPRLALLHPPWSHSQMCRVTTGFVGRGRRNPACCAVFRRHSLRSRPLE